MKLEIKIDSDNAACQTVEDAVWMLQELIRRIKKCDTGSKVMDENGNSVGTWSLQIGKGAK